MRMATQVSPFPELLASLVERTTYRPNWTVKLVDNLDRDQGSVGLTLVITTCGYNSYHPDRGETYRVNHYMPVPPAAFDERSWMRWLLNQFLLVESHEACEFFTIDGEKPYAPHHGPGNDPYIIFDHGTEKDVNTSYLGKLKQPA
jgi:hypothetical protein